MISADAQGAWTELDRRLRPFVARRVRAEPDVDDVLQDVFLRMHRSVGDLRDGARFGPWVYAIARSAVVDHHRRAGRHPEAPSTSPEPEVEPDGLPEEDETLAERALSGVIGAFVATLDEPYRQALTWTELDGLTQREAASRAGISLSGMKSRVQRGRRQLRALIEACCRVAVDARGRVVACEPRADLRRPDGCCA